MSIYTFHNLAIETLLAANNKPMTAQEIWDAAVQAGDDKKLRKVGLTPWQTLGARLYSDLRYNPSSLYSREEGSKPAAFFLKDTAEAEIALNSTPDGLATLSTVNEEAGVESEIPPIPKTGKYPYKERDLHPWLVRFAKYGLGGVFAKTIFHENSSKKSYGEWLHPDIVGFWFPFEDYIKEVRDLAGDGFAVTRFYSFEMKRELYMGNLRESFFQAVSNSSWANEGYLAAPNIDESDEFRAELGRLSGSFGIGVVELDLMQPEASSILFPSRYRDALDWDGANKLARENPDFRKFLSDALIDIKNCRSHPHEYDICPSLDSLAEAREKWAKAILK